MVCKRQEQCVFGEKCIYHIGSVLPKCSIFEQKPPIKQTEQEYIQTCNHKELTEILFRMIVHGSVIRPDRQYISEWLKQPHMPRSKK